MSTTRTKEEQLKAIEMILKNPGPLLDKAEKTRLTTTLEQMQNTLIFTSNLFDRDIELFDQYLLHLQVMLRQYKTYQDNPSSKSAKVNFESAQNKCFQTYNQLKQYYSYIPHFETSELTIVKVEDFLSKLEEEENALDETQKADLTSLCSALREKLDELESNPNDKALNDIAVCVLRTREMIVSFGACQQGLVDTFTTPLVNYETVETRLKSINISQMKFIKDVKEYEKECAKWTLGQKVFMGACTFVGGLLGGILGAAAGLALGATIGGGVGSVVPLFGNIAGAVAAGNVGVVVGILKGVGIGAQVGAAAAATIMMAGTAYAAKKGAGSSLFMSQQQKFVSKLKGSMEKEIKSDAKDAKALLKLKDEYVKLSHAKIGPFFKKALYNRKKDKIAANLAKQEGLETKLKSKK